MLHGADPTRLRCGEVTVGFPRMLSIQNDVDGCC